MTDIKADVKHTKVAAGVNDPTYEVSKDPWNDGHTITVGNPSDIGGANAEGSSTELVRKDHVHKHPVLASGDLHTQYALLLGRSGGQTLIGGTGNGEDLILQSTSHATRGYVILADDLDATGKVIVWDYAVAGGIALVHGYNELRVMKWDESDYRNIRAGSAYLDGLYGRVNSFAFKTAANTSGNLYFYSYDGAWKEGLRLINNSVRMINLPAADPADGTSSLWMDANRFVKVGT